MIYQSVNLYDFRQAFLHAGRGKQYSYVGFELLYDYLTDLSEDLGEPLELDVIGICCDFAEYTLQEIKDDLCVEIDDEDQLEVYEIIDLINDESGYTVATYDFDSDVYILQG